MMILICVVTMAIALLAQWQVRRMYARFRRVPATGNHRSAALGLSSKINRVSPQPIN